jgi:hypothetical protein
MNVIRTILASAVVCLVVALSACSDDGDSVDDLQDPAITLDNIAPYQAIAGTFDAAVTATDDVGVDFVELLVDGAVAATGDEEPFGIAWDTTATPSGVVEVVARVTDRAGKTAQTDPIEVVVVNGGGEMDLTEGNAGTFAIPNDFNGIQEIHEKHHWTSDEAGASRVIAILTWETPENQPAWEFMVEIGSGFCPHTGTTYATSETVGVSPLIFDAAPDGGLPANTQLFVHMSPMNPYEHLGDELSFGIRIFSFE